MASMTMTTSFLGGATAAKKLPATYRRGSVVVRASRDSDKMVATNGKEESNNTRRGLMLAVVAAAACSVANVAMADEPKRGTEEAKKKYAPICVTMPTARICRY
ncbi:Photosystem II 5 kD protein [Perilla frutescens var. hirtella]|uniref:Photosystem II 5 kD protein n=1 Tax=Perilla frutescens var. hirtella TaxID=608512 RepID=A0AAD4IZR4_PERFH|nr:Photosystem II 5 kD protein [Perilla frutescens var. hirtella]KAH6824166.1 Photosystem II 5 kD protein [Perilla frutescens var. hirtella]